MILNVKDGVQSQPRSSRVYPIEREKTTMILSLLTFRAVDLCAGSQHLR